MDRLARSAWASVVPGSACRLLRLATVTWAEADEDRLWDRDEVRWVLLRGRGEVETCGSVVEEENEDGSWSAPVLDGCAAGIGIGAAAGGFCGGGGTEVGVGPPSTESLVLKLSRPPELVELGGSIWSDRPWTAPTQRTRSGADWRIG